MALEYIDHARSVVSFVECSAACRSRGAFARPGPVCDGNDPVDAAGGDIAGAPAVVTDLWTAAYATIDA